MEEWDKQSNRNYAILAIVLIVGFAALHYSYSFPLREAKIKVAQIKPGMKRFEVDRMFSVDTGISGQCITVETKTVPYQHYTSKRYNLGYYDKRNDIKIEVPYSYDKKLEQDIVEGPVKIFKGPRYGD